MGENSRVDEQANTAGQLNIAVDDGRKIGVHQWLPPANRPIAGVILVLHGLGEHALRYRRFAKHGTDAGFVVAAFDHRGHGRSCPVAELGHFADKNGWDLVVSDVQAVRIELRRLYADVPLVLMGHSMGSYVAQCSVMRNAKDVTMMILSATTFADRFRLWLGRIVARVEIMRRGGGTKSTLLNKMSFGDFNKRFAPNRSEFDWLSRDADEVDRYVADPACGAVSSAKLWHDLTGGLLEITSSAALASVPADLPILVFGGEMDPVGGLKGLTRLAGQYRETGHNDVTLRVYEGGRHEMLNEIYRDEVSRDVLEWIVSRLKTRD